MPEVDGLTMLRLFRENPETKDIALDQGRAENEGGSVLPGRERLPVKLPDPIELAARIRHHSRGYIAQIERNEAYAALKASQERLADELAQAAKYVESMLPARLSGEIRTDWRFMPSVELGGDAFGYHWLDADHFAVYLLDVCGHGVKAALLSISAMNVVRNQTLSSTDFRSPAQVLGNLNEAFQMDRHNNLYFTMWYGVYNKTRRQLTYSTGGHPSVILIAGATAETAQPIELSNPGMIVGVFPGTVFDEHVYDLPAFCRLYVFSDGVYEVTKPDGTMMTFPEFLDILAASGGSGGSVIDPDDRRHPRRARQRSVRGRCVDRRGDVVTGRRKTTA